MWNLHVQLTQGPMRHEFASSSQFVSKWMDSKWKSSDDSFSVCNVHLNSFVVVYCWVNSEKRAASHLLTGIFVLQNQVYWTIFSQMPYSEATQLNQIPDYVFPGTSKNNVFFVYVIWIQSVKTHSLLNNLLGGIFKPICLIKKHTHSQMW